MDKKEYYKQWYENNKNLIAKENRERAKEYYYKHREEKKEYQRNYRKNNKDKCYESSRNSRLKNKEYWNDYYKEYSKKNKEKIKERKHQYYLKNKEEIKNKRKKYYSENKDKIKNYYKENRIKINEKLNEYYKKRAKEDNIFKIKVQTRKMIVNSFIKKGMNKSKKTEEIIGISLKEFYYYLLKTFKDNYGYEWDGKEPVHIDHINPLKQCNTEEEVIRCCYYTNLQLLKAEDNLKKGDKTNWELEV